VTRRRPQTSISLFPFLAVLVCAMGALILLLLVMTRRIRHEQFRVDAAPTVVVQPEYSPPDRSLELASLESEQIRVSHDLLELKRQAVELESSIADQQQVVAGLREQYTAMRETLLRTEGMPAPSRITDLQQHISNLRSRQVELRQRLDEQEQRLLAKQLRLKTITETSAAAEQRLHIVRSALVALRRQAHEAQQKTESAGTETIVEFTNTAGTTRTPIVVEVNKSGYTILPAGIVIESKDMEGFPVSDTPLMAAILAVHRERARDSVTSQPYVLLLVRPDGSEAFYPAQGILANEKIHFGYELIGADQVISPGESVPTEIAAANTAMAEAFRRREKIYANLRYIAQGIPPERSETPPDPSRRGLTIRSDGTVQSGAQASGHRASSQNFAGGVAPPPGFYERRAAALAAEAVAREKKRPASEAPATNSPATNSPATNSPLAAATAGEPPLTAEEQFAAMLSASPSAETKSATRRQLLAPAAPAKTLAPAQITDAATSTPGNSTLDLSRVDKDVLDRLQSAVKASRSYATPVGIAVFLDEHHMTVGQQPAIPVTPDSLPAALSDLLQNADTEVNDARKSPHEEVIPVVKFIVSPGGERWRIPLAGSLKQLGIPSASIYELSPHIETTVAPGKAGW
jgi:hypothetical protein